MLKMSTGFAALAALFVPIIASAFALSCFNLKYNVSGNISGVLTSEGGSNLKVLTMQGDHVADANTTD